MTNDMEDTDLDELLDRICAPIVSFSTGDCGVVWDPNIKDIVRVDSGKYSRRSVDDIKIGVKEPIKTRLFKRGSLFKVKSFCELAYKASPTGELYTTNKNFEENSIEEVDQGKIITLLDEGFVIVAKPLSSTSTSKTKEKYLNNFMKRLEEMCCSAGLNNEQAEKVKNSLGKNQKEYIEKYKNYKNNPKQQFSNEAEEQEVHKLLLRYFKILLYATDNKEQQQEKPIIAYVLKHSHLNRDYAETHWFDVVWEPESNDHLQEPMKEKDISDVITFVGDVL